MRARWIWLVSCGVAVLAAACAGSRAGDPGGGAAGGSPSGSVAGLASALTGPVDPATIDVTSREAPVVARLAGAGTAFKDQSDAFAFALRNVGRHQDIAFAEGTNDFVRAWTPDAQPDPDGEIRAGLGPRFNAVSCASCHVNHGRGLLAEDLGELPATAPGTAAPSLGLLLRLSVPEGSGPGTVDVPGYGGQLQDRAVPGVVPEGQLVVTWTEVPGAYGDGTPYSLRRPATTIAEAGLGPLPATLLTSPRLAPPVIGMGLLQAVPEERLLQRADPDDRDGDGVRGRLRRVEDRDTGELVPGRFGWKAGQPTVEAQTGAALFNDMGLTSPYEPADPATPGAPMELDRERFSKLVAYTELLAVPAMRDVDDPQVQEGARRFSSMGCAACHAPTLVTEPDVVKGVNRGVIHPYTDLLLHDMGEGLADGRPEGDASGSEWRTPPLWGIGLTPVVSRHERYLHDGRARSLEEAVLWHGGEAEAARERFRTASAEDRAALLAFLRAL